MAAYLYRAIATPTSTKIFTFSTWVKAQSDASTDTGVVCAALIGNSSYRFNIQFGSGKIQITGSAVDVATTRLFRDPAAWWNIVVAVDTSQVTDTDRCKLYVNGVEVSLAGTFMSQDTTPTFCDSLASIYIGEGVNSGANLAKPFDGLQAHTHFIDGTAYAPTAFGETDSTSGIWVAKTSPSVTYGNNGFFLKYASGAHGTDSSGKGNDYAVSGTLTNTKDCPDNNFCTWTPLLNRVTNASTFTNANTTVKNTNANWGSLGGSLLARSGKWYYEAIGGNTTGPGYMHYGFCSTEYFAMGGGSAGTQGEPSGVVYKPCYTYYGYNGNIYYATNSAINQSSAYGATYANTDYIGVFLDLDNLKMYWSKNGAIQNSGTGMTIDNTNSDFWTPVTGTYVDATGHDTNFGNGVFGTTALGGTTYSDANSEGIFKYSPNDGGASSFDGSAKNFYALCTNNIKLYGG